MIFKSRKSLWIGLVLVAVVILMISTIVTIFVMKAKSYWPLLPLLPALVFLFWTWFGTFYQITQGQLKYKSAFINGSINITDIKEIIVCKTWFVGLKPALATKGLIIKYNRWDDIYISPEKEALFLKELLKVNPEIKIVH